MQLGTFTRAYDGYNKPFETYFVATGLVQRPQTQVHVPACACALCERPGRTYRSYVRGMNVVGAGPDSDVRLAHWADGVNFGSPVSECFARCCTVPWPWSRLPPATCRRESSRFATLRLRAHVTKRVLAGLVCGRRDSAVHLEAAPGQLLRADCPRALVHIASQCIVLPEQRRGACASLRAGIRTSSALTRSHFHTASCRLCLHCESVAEEPLFNTWQEPADCIHHMLKFMYGAWV